MNTKFNTNIFYILLIILSPILSEIIRDIGIYLFP